MNPVKIIILFVSGAGALVSLILLAGYYGVSVSGVEGLCVRGDHGLDNCAIVSMSDYSAIRGVPLLGDIPVALMGFVFFGFLCYLTAFSFFKKHDTNSRSGIFSLAILLVSAAFIVNAALFLVSKYLIKFVCPLCVVTYICVIILLPLIFMLLPFRGAGIRSLIMNVFKNSFYNVKNNLFKYASVFFSLAAFGFLLGIFVFMSPEASLSDMKEDEKVNHLIRVYEKDDPIELVVTSRTMSGNRKAPVEVIIVQDFTCPHCINAGRLFENMRNAYSDLFRIYYISIPISGMCDDFSEDEIRVFGGACIAAIAAACAIDQKKFRVMYEDLYADYSAGVRYSRESVTSIAEKNRFDMERFNKCFDSAEAKRFVRANLAQAENAGVTAIPAVFVDGRRMPYIINNEEVLWGFLEYLKRRKGM